MGRTSFNPVAGIHCNESVEFRGSPLIVRRFNPVAGIHCNERGHLIDWG